MKTNSLVNTKIHSPCLSTKINLTSSKMNFSWELHYRWLQHSVWLVSSATTKDEAGAQNLKTNDDADAFSHVSWALTTNSDQQRCHSLPQHFWIFTRRRSAASVIQAAVSWIAVAALSLVRFSDSLALGSVLGNLTTLSHAPFRCCKWAIVSLPPQPKWASYLLLSRTGLCCFPAAAGVKTKQLMI